jgi:tetratricopeptide (TPR) repeat protein
VASRPESSHATRYTLGFGATVIILTASTLLLVLVVLPRRYMLHSGLREGGLTFPALAPVRRPVTAPVEKPMRARAVPVSPASRGPAEIMWSTVDPLLENEDYAAAIAVFEAYLRRFPGDRGARRELALTLQKAGRADEAIQVYEALLRERDNPGVRLLLARALRDAGRIAEASEHYRALVAASPGDATLRLEWARALAWNQRYDEAANVLEPALESTPEAVDLRVEMARILHWEGRAVQADALLEGLDLSSLEASGAIALQIDIKRALAPVNEEPVDNEQPEPEPPTLLERAEAAAAAGDYPLAAELLAEAVRRDPTDRAALGAYADVLQYHLEDLEGAREVLLRLEAMGETDAEMRLRMARLAIWTGRNDEAADRLEALLPELDPAGRAEVHVLLGDLHRWAGRRREAGAEYHAALELDIINDKAHNGLAALAEAERKDIEEVERARLGGNAFSLADSDEFQRLDLGVEGVGIDGTWVWGVRTGMRHIGGLGLASESGAEQGIFLESEVARWWGWGTVRTGVHVGLEEVRVGQRDLSFGASLRWPDVLGFRADVRYDHGPAYPLVITLQSVFADLIQDRLQIGLNRTLGERWSLSLLTDAARLTPDRQQVAAAEASTRLEQGASLGRQVSGALVLGFNARALTYTSASPASPEGSRLFWDPERMISTGVFARLDRDLTEQWKVRAQVNPSLAFLDERGPAGFERVPHFSTELGVTYRGSRLRTDLDAFYYQGRFDGYRAYGIRLSFSTAAWPWKGSGR